MGMQTPASCSGHTQALTLLVGPSTKCLPEAPPHHQLGSQPNGFPPNYSGGGTTPEGTAVIHTNAVEIVLRVLLDHLHYELCENVFSSAGSACSLCDICHLMGTPFDQLEDLRWSPALVR